MEKKNYLNTLYLVASSYIHKKAHSVDWLLVNNSSKPQKYRVTIYEVSSHDRKVITPAPLTGTLEPTGRTHNANGIGEERLF